MCFEEIRLQLAPLHGGVVDGFLIYYYCKDETDRDWLIAAVLSVAVSSKLASHSHIRPPANRLLLATTIISEYLSVYASTSNICRNVNNNRSHLYFSKAPARSLPISKGTD